MIAATPRGDRNPAAGPGRVPVPLSIEPMEARLVDRLPDGDGWQFEPKWDGFRCLAFKSGGKVELRAKSGKPLTRYFPELADALAARLPASCVIDGELVIPSGGTISFGALQLRLHPAESRVRRLAAETPSLLIAFDCLAAPGAGNLLEQPLARRREALESVHAALGDGAPVRLSPFTRDRSEAERWLGRVGGALDGIVAKRLDGPYESGERAMLKVKRMRTADCVVGGFRYAAGGALVGSLLLGLYDETGLLHHVGFTSGFAGLDRAALTAELEDLVGPPGFTGRAPGGPSRWSNARSAEWQPLRPERVVEVRYDHVTADRFRHGVRFLRWRPDKAPRQCTFEQLEREASPGRLIRAVLNA